MGAYSGKNYYDTMYTGKYFGGGNTKKAYGTYKNPYASIEGDSLMGGTPPYGSKKLKALSAKQFQQQQYNYLKQALFGDPALNLAMNKAGEMANKDWMGMGMSAAQHGADIASQGLASALAARGGGGIGSALALGAKGRVGAQLKGMQAGMQMQSASLAPLMNALQQKWGTLTSLYAPAVGASATLGAANISSQGGGSILDSIKDIF